jgi:hypothetical protein
VLALQRSHGNRAVSQWLARKVKTPAKKGLDYKLLERRNRAWAKSLGWGERLKDFKPDLAALWDADEQEAFADAVAAYQREQGLKADGELGPGTWNRLRPIGEVIADVRKTEAYDLCYMFSRERMETGYRKATGKALVGKGERQKYDWILGSRVEHMKDVPEEYRGKGAAGALVFLGKGEFVADVWKDLKPGAALQVWRHAEAVDKLKEGEEGDEDTYYGTSAVFLEYTDDGNAMKVLHWNGVETWDKSRWGLIIGANPKRPEEKK